jgi:hypothetical protein
MNSLTTWSVLVLTFPTENATARMRAWRALKAKGCVVLRDGIYLLPHTAEREDEMRELAGSIDEAGGSAHLLRAQSLDSSQEGDFRALFDRNDDYGTFVASLGAARKTLGGQPPAEVTRLLRRLRKDYDAIRTIDYFPGTASTDAEIAWEDFVALADTVLSPGEPHAAERAIRPLRRDEYQARTWATRQRLWVDRVASAWLIRRFNDPKARFLWLDSPEACPPDALGFDFDGAAFTHVGERVTFEVLLVSFGLDDDAALLRLGEMVHALDVGGAPVPEAIGFEAVMAGARQRALDDDQLLVASQTQGTLYAAPDFRLAEGRRAFPALRANDHDPHVRLSVQLGGWHPGGVPRNRAAAHDHRTQPGPEGHAWFHSHLLELHVACVSGHASYGRAETSIRRSRRPARTDDSVPTLRHVDGRPIGYPMLTRVFNPQIAAHCIVRTDSGRL